MNASDFGATGDGRTDDAPALRSALAAAADRHAALALQPGTYSLDSAVTFPDGVDISAERDSAWLRGPVTVGSAAVYTRLRFGDTATSPVSFPSGAHDLRFEHCRFGHGASPDAAVLTLNGPCRRLAFTACTIGPGPANGVSIVDTGGTVRDISFSSCTIRSSARMGFECISRGSSNAVYQGIRLRDCLIDAQGSEAMSFDGPSVPARCVIDNVVVEGAGTNPDYPWDAGFEINGPTGFTVRRLVIKRTRGSMLNLTCRADASRWTFADCVFDYDADATATRTNPDARTISAVGMHHAVFTRCVFNAGDAAYNNGWLSDCSNNDLSTCRFSGVGRRARVSQVNGSSANRLP